MNINYDNQAKFISIGVLVAACLSAPYAIMFGFAGFGGVAAMYLGEALGPLVIPLYFLLGVAGTLFLLCFGSAVGGAFSFGIQWCVRKTSHVWLKLLIIAAALLFTLWFARAYQWYWHEAFGDKGWW